MKTRNYKYDNIKVILIFLVVFAHLLELWLNDTTLKLYHVIYSFHMPVFIFLTGYFARFNRRRIGFGFLFTYVVFQKLYLTFDGIIIRKVAYADIQFQYTTPYWLLWYLVAITFYYLLIPVIDTKDIRVKLGLLLLSGVLALLVGNDYSVGNYMTLARAINFFPYFLTGYYLHSTKMDELEQVGPRAAAFTRTFFRRLHTLGEKPPIRMFCRIFCIALAVIAAVYVWNNGTISNEAWYGRANYQDGTYGEKLKILVFVIAFVWLLAFMCVTPDRKIPFVTRLGENTFPVFLCHGFVVKYLTEYNIFTYGTRVNLLITAGIAVVLVLALGNALVGKVFSFIFMGKWGLFA